MRQKRRSINSSRRMVQPANRGAIPTDLAEPDILQIWEQQRRMREREAQLEREYEAAKRHLKDVKLRMRQNNSLLGDSAILTTTFRESASQSIGGFWLWLKKSLKKLNLKAEIGYISLRLRLGIPLKGRTRFARERAVVAVLVVVAVGALIIWPGGGGQNDNQTAVQGTNQSASGEIDLNQAPEFPVLTPNGNGAANLGGFARVSPDGVAPTYAYVDKINDIIVRVSQQQLPTELKDKTKLKQMAQDFNANRELATDQGIVYIGQSAKGPQSVIFARDGLLVLIASDAEIADSAWKTYLASLSV